MNSPTQPSGPISISSCSSNVLPNAGLWFVNRFQTIISTTRHCTASISDMWTHLSDPQTWLAYHHAPMISHQVPASDWSIHYSSYCFYIGNVTSSQWVLQLISVQSHSSDFLLPETKSCPRCRTLLHWMVFYWHWDRNGSWPSKSAGSQCHYVC